MQIYVKCHNWDLLSLNIKWMNISTHLTFLKKMFTYQTFELGFSKCWFTSYFSLWNDFFLNDLNTKEKYFLTKVLVGTRTQNWPTCVQKQEGGGNIRIKFLLWIMFFDWLTSSLTEWVANDDTMIIIRRVWHNIKFDR